MRRKAIASLFLAYSIACSSTVLAQSISSQTAPGVDFNAYATFNWDSATPPRGMNPVMYQQIMADVEQQLIQKGYRKAEPGELTLILTIGAREKTDIQTWGRFGLQTNVYQYTEGQLSLDAFDTRTAQALWHGQASQTINPKKPNPSKVRKAIVKLMAKFPARDIAAAPASR